jgi:hypothetical protein
MIRSNQLQKYEESTHETFYTQTYQADEFVSQHSVRGLSVSIYEYGILLLYEEMIHDGQDIRNEES